MRFSALVGDLVDEVVGHGDPEIEHLTIDVNEVQPGTLFAARREWYGDTHTQLAEAVARGAVGLLISQGDGQGFDVPVAIARQEDPALGLSWSFDPSEPWTSGEPPTQ